MTSFLTDIAPQHVWDAAIQEGFIRTQTHPTLPLTVFNYTPAAQYAKHWTPVTLAARGLVANTDTGQIVARPLPKFFNLTEHTPQPAHDIPVVVSDKVDGSMALLFPTGGGQFACSTRGSFTSSQALHATELWAERYAPIFTPPADVSLIFEVVYPGNRIVTDYGSLDDLVLLAAVNITTGLSVANLSSLGWPGRVAETLPYVTLAEALAAPDRPGDTEGFVVHYPDTDLRVKVKQAEYVYLHKIMTTTSIKDLWIATTIADLLAAGVDAKAAARVAHTSTEAAQVIQAAGDRWMNPLIENVPDEFYGWVTSSVSSFRTHAAEFTNQAQEDFLALGLRPVSPDDREYRKQAVQRIVTESGDNHARKAALLMILNGRSVLGIGFQDCEPEAGTAFWAQNAAPA